MMSSSQPSTYKQLSVAYGYLMLLIFAQLWLEVFCGEKLALLSATLRTYQKAACDTDQVVITCPRGTSISIEFAQYNKFIAKDGISIEELCPANDDGIENRTKAKHLLRGSTFGSPTQKVPANRYVNGVHLSEATTLSGASTSDAATTSSISNNDDNSPENCMWPNAMQYSLLQTVVEACQKKKHCKFNGRPQFYGVGASGVGDASGSSSYHSSSSTISSTIISAGPCPKRRKIVEIAYKCRPYEFRSKVACHNDVAQLECNPYSRIAVYSASFGRTEYESIQCPQPQGVREETCLAAYATETVMQICHGRRRCNLAADANTFGSPCQPNSRMYLKVVYTCVPKQVLMDRYETEVEADEPEDFEGDINDLYDDELFYKESEAIPKLYSNTTMQAARNNANATTADSSTYNTNTHRTNNGSLAFEGDIGSVNPVMTHSADMTLEGDQERLFVYLLTAGSVGVILCIIAVAVRVVLLKRHESETDTHSTSSGKIGIGAAMGGGGGAGGGVALGVEGIVETTIPNGFNDTVPEVEADIDLQTPIPVPSVSMNETYISYAPTAKLSSSLEPSNTLMAQGSTAGSVPSNLMSNTTILCGPRQSPDILHISPQLYAATSSSNNGSPTIGGILAPAIVLGSSGGSIVSSGNNVIGTVVPISSLAQYTTAPTFRSDYILNSGNVRQRQPNMGTPPTSLSANNETYMCQQQPTLTVNTGLTSTTATLRRMKQENIAPKAAASPPPPSSAAGHHVQQHPHAHVMANVSASTYDGLAPRTLSTGISSQFYYG